MVWDDRAPTIRAGSALCGLDSRAAMRWGRWSTAPSVKLLGMRLAEVEEGRAVFASALGDYQHEPLGTVHGRIPATLLDSAMGSAVRSLAPIAMATRRSNPGSTSCAP
jgi:acyl-coenzyme A thioesterase PaaI-like protein